MNQSPRNTVNVAAGILYRDDGAFLLSSRPQGKVYAGFWEFAGGKAESGESIFAALQREFHEELGISITHATPWLTRIHDYEHARVALYFYRIAADSWHGTIHARERQNFCWQQADDVRVSPLLPANEPILTALAIPNQLSGSLKTGFFGYSKMGKRFDVWPWQRMENHHAQIVFAFDERDRIRSLPSGMRVWLAIDHAEQWRWVQDADAVVWRVQNANDAQALLAVLTHGVAVPVLPLADDVLLRQYGAAWLATGAHGLIKNETIAVV
ncbi:NUDIX domain-containing protein [Stenoxybacter acetivorans]|uniref:NUDIX domain-containing protein n=1 Tax=Stenoxybacter acetivorans TaxID=422441 RepID=UPI00055B51CC|nr:NUDIX domain-containing protein [Stenoxybacter acetivorans]